MFPQYRTRSRSLPPKGKRLSAHVHVVFGDVSYLGDELRQRLELFRSIEDAVHDDHGPVAVDAHGAEQQQQQRRGAAHGAPRSVHVPGVEQTAGAERRTGDVWPPG